MLFKFCFFLENLVISYYILMLVSLSEFEYFKTLYFIVIKDWTLPILFFNQPKSTKDFTYEAYFYLTQPVKLQNNCKYSGVQTFLDIVLTWSENFDSVNEVFGPYFFGDNVKQENY